MQIDNSRASYFRTCPMLYWEKYERNGTGVEPIKRGEDYGALDLGSRVHELLECYYKGIKGDPVPAYPAHPVEACEAEAQWMFEAYKAHYPADNWEIVDVERTFEVKLPPMCPECYGDCENLPGILLPDYCRRFERKARPSQHSLIGKIDLIIRDKDSGEYFIVDHKTQNRSSKSNLPQKWAAKDQASLYLYACDQLYPFEVSNFLVNVLVRPSPAGEKPPSFQDRQKIERSEAQIKGAVRDIVYIADQIEKMRAQFPDGKWPMNRDNCFTWGYCDYWPLHGYGEDVELVLAHKFQQRKEYLEIKEAA